jgi:hypothetical protein
MAVVVAMPVFADNLQKITNAGSDNVAIKGYDSVAYFTEGQSMKGKPEFTYFWNDANWHFTNAAHRDLFVADPERYVPQFGGFCSMALVVGKVKDIDPEVWTIVDGKLYLNFSKAFRDKFRKNATKNIKKAAENWKGVLKKN